MLAILAFGGEAGRGIELVMPEEEEKLEELSLIFELKYGKFSDDKLAREASELWKRYKEEGAKVKIRELQERLEEADEEEQNKILQEVMELQPPKN